MTAWCAPAGSPAPMAATRRCAAGPGSMPATTRAAASGARAGSAGAEAGHWPVRRWAGLDACHHESRRFGFRRHYRVAPWSQYMEIHWGDGCQLYITPVADEEVCVVLISRNQHLRLEDALPGFPAVERRLAAANASNLQRGGVTTSRRLKAVCRGNVALVGDASGSVDAI